MNTLWLLKHMNTLGSFSETNTSRSLQHMNTSIQDKNVPNSSKLAYFQYQRTSKYPLSDLFTFKFVYIIYDAGWYIKSPTV